MEALMEQALKGLLASGPLVLILAGACWKLWNANREDRAMHEKEMKEERDRHAAEEKALQDRLFSQLEKLADAMKGGH